MPGSDDTVAGTAVADWLDDDGNPKYGDESKGEGDAKTTPKARQRMTPQTTPGRRRVRMTRATPETPKTTGSAPDGVVRATPWDAY